MSITRLSPPSSDARGRLIDLVAHFDEVIGDETLFRLDPDPGITAWAEAVERRGPYGFLAVQHRLGKPTHVDFEPLVALHQQAGFVEAHRGSYTYVTELGEKTTSPISMMVHDQLGILAYLRGHLRPGDGSIGACETHWWLNAVVIDPAPFRAMGARRSAPGELWLRAGQTSELPAFRGLHYDELLLGGRDAYLPLQRQLFVGALRFDDPGIADRLDVLRASSAMLSPWFLPAVPGSAFGPSLHYGMLSDDPRPWSDIDQDSLDNTRRILNALPGHVHRALGWICADTAP